MIKALDQVFEEASRLPEAEQKRLAAELEPLVIAARQRAVREMILRARRDSPFHGKSAEMKALIQADRANWAFGPDRFSRE